MKQVSFKVAKALKEAGYPQLKADWSYDVNGGGLFNFVDTEDYVISAPTYLDVWVWLWREKNIKIVAEPRTLTYVYIKAPFYGLPLELNQSFDDPEDAIIAAIEYLCDNDLIK